MTDTTKINPDESALPDGLVIGDLRRQFDRRTLENIERDHSKVREMSGRLTRLETLFEQIKTDLGKMEHGQREGLVFHEQTANSVSEINSRLTAHTEMEEVQWGVVNRANEHLEQLSASLSHHLETMGVIATRLDWIERLVFGVYGAAGSMFMLVGGWLLSRMG